MYPGAVVYATPHRPNQFWPQSLAGNPSIAVTPAIDSKPSSLLEPIALARSMLHYVVRPRFGLAISALNQARQ
jgi:hypothetical protein